MTSSPIGYLLMFGSKPRKHLIGYCRNNFNSASRKLKHPSIVLVHADSRLTAGHCPAYGCWRRRGPWELDAQATANTPRRRKFLCARMAAGEAESKSPCALRAGPIGSGEAERELRDHERKEHDV